MENADQSQSLATGTDEQRVDRLRVQSTNQSQILATEQRQIDLILQMLSANQSERSSSSAFHFIAMTLLLLMNIVICMHKRNHALHDGKYF